MSTSRDDKIPMMIINSLNDMEILSKSHLKFQQYNCVTHFLREDMEKWINITMLFFFEKTRDK